MKAHELAAALLAGPNHKVILNVYGHKYDAETQTDSHGGFSVVNTGDGRLPRYRQPCVMLCCAIDARRAEPYVDPEA